jgi:hypothetical protein
MIESIKIFRRMPGLREAVKVSLAACCSHVASMALVCQGDRLRSIAKKQSPSSGTNIQSANQEFSAFHAVYLMTHFQ